jgi:hypothetical protein
MPNATSIQLLFRLPIKKDSLSDLREVYQATVSSKTKYPITNVKSIVGDILQIIFNFEDKEIYFPFAAI